MKKNSHPVSRDPSPPFVHSPNDLSIAEDLANEPKTEASLELSQEQEINLDRVSCYSTPNSSVRDSLEDELRNISHSRSESKEVQQIFAHRSFCEPASESESDNLELDPSASKMISICSSAQSFYDSNSSYIDEALPSTSKCHIDSLCVDEEIELDISSNSASKVSPVIPGLKPSETSTSCSSDSDDEVTTTSEDTEDDEAFVAKLIPLMKKRPIKYGLKKLIGKKSFVKRQCDAHSLRRKTLKTGFRCKL